MDLGNTLLEHRLRIVWRVRRAFRQKQKSLQKANDRQGRVASGGGQFHTFPIGDELTIVAVACEELFYAELFPFGRGEVLLAEQHQQAVLALIERDVFD